MRFHETKIPARFQDAMNFVHCLSQVGVNVMKSANHSHTVERVVRESRLEQRSLHRLTAPPLTAKGINHFAGNVQPRNDGLVLQQELSCLTASTHGIKHPHVS